MKKTYKASEIFTPEEAGKVKNVLKKFDGKVVNIKEISCKLCEDSGTVKVFGGKNYISGKPIYRWVDCICKDNGKNQNG